MATYVYNSITNQYFKQNAAIGPEGLLKMIAPQLSIQDQTKMKRTSKTLGAESVVVEGEKHDCWVVETKVDKLELPNPPGSEADGMVMTSWIEKKTGIRWQLATVMKMRSPGAPEAGTMHQKLVLKSLTIDEPLPDSLFVFTPPAGASETDTVLGSMLPKGDLAGKEAPPFNVKGLDAKSYSFAALKGRPVLLDFWATWCRPCQKSLPFVEKIYQDFKDQGLIVLGVDVGEGRATLEEFLKKNPIRYPVVLGGEDDIANAYSVSAFPTFVMIGRDGKVAAHVIGFEGEAALREMVKKADLTLIQKRDH